MAATATKDQVSLTLLVNKEKSKVLFAEARKDFVDVLFSFLTLPLGTIARLVDKESNMPPARVGCLSSLYESVAKLDQQCFWTETCKEMLLRPRNSSEDYCRSLKLNIDDTGPTKYFLCEDLLDSCEKRLLSTFKTQRCDCGKFFTKEVPFKSNGTFEGFVKDGATFVITDDLIVMPNSMDTRLTSFGLLQNSGVENISSAHQVTVNVTHKKVLDLLKCSLISKSTLTDFFFGKKPALEMSRFCSCDAAASSSIQINVKLMMRKSDGRILYAQGEEDFADFLFSFLTLPLGAVVRLLEGHSYVGSIDGMYNSIVDLNQNKYLISHELKNRLVDPRHAPYLIKQKFPISESYLSQYFCYYRADLGARGSILNHRCYVASERRPCDYKVEGYLTLEHSKSYGGSSRGYVKGPTMYIATDDLVVAPMSPIFGISLLNRLNVPLDDLMEKAITIGIKEGLSILKASLTTTSALTNGLSHLITEVKEEK